ncbi:MAG: hypothetical protein APF81_10585 [Desulfosporosinus sp. BRH_c37]|nr:MAG: hypothetical protein APF81_10585 [Desulfosporosinus sp. BRH_c37]
MAWNGEILNPDTFRERPAMKVKNRPYLFVEHVKRYLYKNANSTTGFSGRSKTPWDPSQRKFLSLGSTESGIASMNADDKALRNATVHMQKAQRFCVLALTSSE